VDRILSDKVEISGPTFKPRTVQRSDFEYVEGTWQDFLGGLLRRDELNLSQNTTYILTLLDWVDSN